MNTFIDAFNAFNAFIDNSLHNYKTKMCTFYMHFKTGKIVKKIKIMYGNALIILNFYLLNITISTFNQFLVQSLLTSTQHNIISLVRKLSVIYYNYYSFVVYQEELNLRLINL